MNIPADWLDELTNIEMSKRLRWADSLKFAGEYELAEVVFPDTPEYLAHLEMRELEHRSAA